jgi:hypothetical protein
MQRRFTRGHLLNHVGKSAATPYKLQARPLPPESDARKDSDLSHQRGTPERLRELKNPFVR